MPMRTGQDSIAPWIIWIVRCSSGLGPAAAPPPACGPPMAPNGLDMVLRCIYVCIYGGGRVTPELKLFAKLAYAAFECTAHLGSPPSFFFFLVSVTPTPSLRSI